MTIGPLEWDKGQSWSQLAVATIEAVAAYGSTIDLSELVAGTKAIADQVNADPRDFVGIAMSYDIETAHWFAEVVYGEYGEVEPEPQVTIVVDPPIEQTGTKQESGGGTVDATVSAAGELQISTETAPLNSTDPDVNESGSALYVEGISPGELSDAGGTKDAAEEDASASGSAPAGEGDGDDGDYEDGDEGDPSEDEEAEGYDDTKDDPTDDLDLDEEDEEGGDLWVDEWAWCKDHPSAAGCHSIASPLAVFLEEIIAEAMIWATETMPEEDVRVAFELVGVRRWRL